MMAWGILLYAKKKGKKMANKDNIILSLVSFERNMEMLKAVPHAGFLDLAVIYRVVIAFNDGGMGTVLVNNGMMEDMGLTKEGLHKTAYENSLAVYSNADDIKRTNYCSDLEAAKRAEDRNGWIILICWVFAWGISKAIKASVSILVTHIKGKLKSSWIQPTNPISSW